MFIKSYPLTKSVTRIPFIRKYLWLSFFYRSYFALNTCFRCYGIKVLHWIYSTNKYHIVIYYSVNKYILSYFYWSEHIFYEFLLNLRYMSNIWVPTKLWLLQNLCALSQYTHTYYVRHKKDYIFHIKLFYFKS